MGRWRLTRWRLWQVYFMVEGILIVSVAPPEGWVAAPQCWMEDPAEARWRPAKVKGPPRPGGGPLRPVRGPTLNSFQLASLHLANGQWPSKWGQLI
jgi:hypothetical protein